LGAITALVLLLLSLLIYRLVNGETLGRQLQVAREDEEFAEAIGINYHSARIKVFLISCAGLGFIGAFYAMYFRSISVGVFSLDQLMLLFAMIVIGGTERAEGAVLGTAIVILIDRGLFELGPMRIVIIAVVMILVTTYTYNGITGIRQQFRNFRNRFQTQKRSLITTKGDQVNPYETTYSSVTSGGTNTSDSDAGYIRLSFLDETIIIKNIIIKTCHTKPCSNENNRRSDIIEIK
jgi:branched-chain amino acid transport system permease protein